MTNRDNYVTIGTLAELLGIDRWRVAYLIERCILPEASVTVPGRRLFSEKDVERVKQAYSEYLDTKKGDPR